jgi:hypothetical protein
MTNKQENQPLNRQGTSLVAKGRPSNKSSEIQAKHAELSQGQRVQHRAGRLTNGLYVKECVEGVPVVYTADKGASKTVISTRVFERIEASRRTVLRRAGCLKGVWGSMIIESGKCWFSVNIGAYTSKVEAIVADIEDDALLGVDVLLSGNGGPVDILMSKGHIVIDGG